MIRNVWGFKIGEDGINRIFRSVPIIFFSYESASYDAEKSFEQIVKRAKRARALRTFEDLHGG